MNRTIFKNLLFHTLPEKKYMKKHGVTLLFSGRGLSLKKKLNMI